MKVPNLKTESHRFYLAVLIVVAMVSLISIPTFFRDYDSSKELAAIFSGWITAIVGFYFLQQNTERVYEELKKVSQEAREAREKTLETMKKLSNVVSIFESSIGAYRRLFQDINKINKELMELEKLEGVEE